LLVDVPWWGGFASFIGWFWQALLEKIRVHYVIATTLLMGDETAQARERPPDRSSSAGRRSRKMKEATLKRVSAARDELAT
jgi:hypothetical protein